MKALPERQESFSYKSELLNDFAAFMSKKVFLRI
jgi:hypothetical protein